MYVWSIFVSNVSRCTEVCFASFLSSGFTTMEVINPQERKLAKRTSVEWVTKGVASEVHDFTDTITESF